MVSTKIPYGVGVLLHQRVLHPIFPIGLVKTESNVIVRSAETDLRRITLVLVVISVETYPFLTFSDLACHLEDTEIGVFWLHCAT